MEADKPILYFIAEEDSLTIKPRNGGSKEKTKKK